MVDFDLSCSFERLRCMCIFIIGFQISNAIIQFIYHHFIALWIKKPLIFEQLGKWAVIAGATNGLGRAFAAEFAKRGMSIVLLDRNKKEEDLKYLAKEIGSTYNVETLIISSDLSPKTATYRDIYTQMVNLEIGILVINFHELQTRPAWLYKDDPDVDMEAEIERIITGNIHFTTWLLRTLLPNMAFRSKGLCLIVSSITTLFPTPLLAPTSAAKTYCAYLARLLSLELQGQVDVRILLPGLLQCHWLNLRAPSILAPSPAQYLRSALPLVARHERTTGYWLNDILTGFLRIFNYVYPMVAQDLTQDCLELIRDVSIRGYLPE